MGFSGSQGKEKIQKVRLTNHIWNLMPTAFKLHLTKTTSGNMFSVLCRLKICSVPQAKRSALWSVLPQNLHKQKEERRAMEFKEFKFQFDENNLTPFNFISKIETSNQVAERNLKYEEMQEINRVLKPHNVKAAGIFPRFKMWLGFSEQPQEKHFAIFQQVRFPLFSFFTISSGRNQSLQSLQFIHLRLKNIYHKNLTSHTIM
jgi:hypothetical protein